MRVTLERGALRWLTLGSFELVRGIYGAVRSANWGTIEPRFTAYAVTHRGRSFAVRFAATHRQDDIDFSWDCRIDAEPHRLSVEMDGRAGSDFLANRIGLCVLHPDAMAGSPLRVQTPWGEVDGRFPERIAGVSCFSNIEAITQELPGGSVVSIRFAGDLFEMEDQRNWTDASFKTFGTPLSLPRPRLVEAGSVIRQSVVISVEGRARGRHRPQPPMITVGDQAFEPLPPIGLAAGPTGIVATDDMLARVGALHISHLRVSAETASDLHDSTFSSQLKAARQLDIPVELEIVAGSDGGGIGAVLTAVHASRTRLVRVLVFDGRSLTTTGRQLKVLRSAARELGLSVPLGGGSLADFFELNTANTPIDQMDVVGYRVTPQIHAFDDASIMETLGGQFATVESTRAMAGARQIAVGPVTLRQLFNPAAADPAHRKVSFSAMADPRQTTLFGAAWTVGSIAVMSAAGAGSISIHQVAGPAAVQPGPSESGGTARTRRSVVYPVYHVLADILAEGSAPRRLEVDPAEVGRKVATLALAGRNGIRVLLANLTDETQIVDLRLPVAGETVVRTLDIISLRQATLDPDRFRAHQGRPFPGDRRVSIELGPYAIARIQRSTAAPSVGWPPVRSD